MNKQEEKIELAEIILSDLELQKISLQDILLKTLKLCRLIKDLESEKIFRFETCGYPRNKDGTLTSESWTVINQIGRYYYKCDKNGQKIYAETRLVGEMLEENDLLKIRLGVTADPTSYGANFNPYMIQVSKNTIERSQITNQCKHNINFISTIKGFTYNYVLNIYNQLKYGDIAQNIYEDIRNVVDVKLAQICPDNIKKFLSVYENLNSDNSEDWANAVHSCRRIIKELADNLYPPQNEKIKHKGKEISISDGNYINRLMLYIESKETGNTYKNIVGSSLNYIGETLDSLTEGLNKGTHDKYSKIDAERIVIYTYMLIGDILRL